ncbi:MAG: HD domain-containing protein [Oligoflexia bacterium]|nr:HD domain-containing protein [Oligoflexia bacterium]
MDQNGGQKYFKIRLASMHPNRKVAFDVFILINGRYVLYMRSGATFEGEKLEHFKSKRADVFFVKEEDRAAYKTYIRDRIGDDEHSPEEKALILKESSFSLVEELFENPKIDQALEESKSVISNFVDFIDAEPTAVANLIGLSSHDFYTYNHSLDVAVYSLGLALKAGYKNKNDLMEIGRGALFHDVGKRKVSVEIICKKGGLDDNEWAQMKRHPLYGLQILNEFQGIPDGVKACVFEHHENHIGNGYPQGLKGSEIHPMARIVALTDTYDALTTKRSYNDPMSPSDALTLMKEKLAGRFDPDLLKAMYSVLFKLK